MNGQRQGARWLATPCSKLHAMGVLCSSVIAVWAFPQAALAQSIGPRGATSQLRPSAAIEAARPPPSSVPGRRDWGVYSFILPPSMKLQSSENMVILTLGCKADRTAIAGLTWALIQHCVDSSWPSLLYSLRFPKYPQAAGDPSPSLIGHWFVYDSSGSSSIDFGAGTRCNTNRSLWCGGL